MSEDKALELVARQRFGSPENFGPKAPYNREGPAFLFSSARKRGFSMIVEVFTPGMTAMAAPVKDREGKAIGVVTVAGPLFRLTEERMLALGPQLIATAGEIAQTSSASPLFRTRVA